MAAAAAREPKWKSNLQLGPLVLFGRDVEQALKDPDDPLWQALIQLNDSPWAHHRPAAIRGALQFLKRGLHTLANSEAQATDEENKERLFKLWNDISLADRATWVNQFNPDELRLMTEEEVQAHKMRTGTSTFHGLSDEAYTALSRSEKERLDKEIVRRNDLLRGLWSRESLLDGYIWQTQLGFYPDPKSRMWRTGYSNHMHTLITQASDHTRVGEVSDDALDLEATMLWLWMNNQIQNAFQTTGVQLFLVLQSAMTGFYRDTDILFWLRQIPLKELERFGRVLYTTRQTNTNIQQQILALIRQTAKDVNAINQANLVRHLIMKQNVPHDVIRHALQPHFIGTPVTHSAAVLTAIPNAASRKTNPARTRSLEDETAEGGAAAAVAAASSLGHKHPRHNP